MLNKVKTTSDRVLTLIENGSVLLAALSLLVMMVSISIDALGRYFFNHPLQGQYEFTSLYLMVIFTFMALAKTQALGRHVSVPIFDRYVDRVPFDLLRRFTTLSAALAFALLTWVAGIEAMHRIIDRTTLFGVIQFPTYLSYFWVPLGTGLLTLRLVHQTLWPVERRPE